MPSGGAARSKHMDGAAFDIAMANHDPVGIRGRGTGEVGLPQLRLLPALGFMHVDLGPVRHGASGSRSERRHFAAENPRRARGAGRKPDLRGSEGAAGVATLGAAGLEIAQSVVAETQTAILPLVPYLDTLRMGVHRRRARRNRGHDLRPPRRRLAPGAPNDRRAPRPDRSQPVGAGGASLRPHRARNTSVPAFASAVWRASGTPRERLEATEKANDVQRRMLEAAGSPPS